MSDFYTNNDIRIRPYQASDAPGLYACVRASLPEFGRYLPWVHPEYSVYESEQWVHWAQQNWVLGCQYDLVVERCADGQFLGGVGLLSVDPLAATANLGYFIRQDEAGKGYTTAAARLIMAFAREQLGLQSLHIYCALPNIASQRVAQKLGGVLLNTIERYEYVNGVWLDSQHYELLL